MKDREIYAALKTMLSPYLEPHGFTCEESRKATYYKRVSDDLYLFILCDLFADRKTFDVAVFPSTPRLGNWNFPDGVGILSGNRARLNTATGVGGGASRFPCKDIGALTTSVSKALIPALEAFAVPYLEQFRSLQDVVPVLEHPQWASLL